MTPQEFMQKQKPPRPTRKELQAQVHALLAQVDELKQQLAAAQECVKVCRALKKMPFDYSLFHRQGEYKSWCVARMKTIISEADTIAEALRAAGLMKQEGE